MKMKTTNSRLVITGMGAVTPIGIGVENYWKNLVAENAVWKRLPALTPKSCR